VRIANGDFSVRVADNIGRRRDEVADLAKRFDDMTRKLGTASRAQKSLFRDVSHEPRSPLTRTRIAAELLASGPAGNRPTLADRLDREIGAMDRLIAEILTLSLLNDAPDAMQFDVVTAGSVSARNCERGGFEVTIDIPERAQP